MTSRAMLRRWRIGIVRPEFTAEEAGVLEMCLSELLSGGGDHWPLAGYMPSERAALKRALDKLAIAPATKES